MHVSALYIYPVKSCAGISVDEAVVARRGFAHDRRWMIVDEEGEFLTQREYPEMALVETHLDGETLVLSHPRNEPLELPLAPADGTPTEVRVWRSTCLAHRFSDEADHWFGEVLQADVRLVYMPDSTHRRVNPEFGSDDDIVSFADGYPFLLIGQASLDDLNERLEQPVTMKRFRPNIVIEGAGPFAEDEWSSVDIGEVSFRVAKPCARCVVTTVDPERGEKGTEPLATLATYRRIDGKVLFGQNLIHESAGTIHVGDPLEPQPDTDD